MPQMDTKGNLYNFYDDLDGERKITPVGNVSDLQQFKVQHVFEAGGEGAAAAAAAAVGGRLPPPWSSCPSFFFIFPTPCSSQVSEIAGVKLDRDVKVVAFKDGREIPLPPGTGFMDRNGKVRSRADCLVC